VTAIPQAVAERLTEALQDVFDSAERIAVVVQDIWSRNPNGLTSRDFSPLRDVIVNELSTHPHFAGCGYVAAVDALSDAHRYWEWFKSGDQYQPAPRPLVLHTGAEGGETYAYEQMEWYTRAREGVAVIVGPYLDFAGADKLVLTFATPVLRSGRFVGIAGADVSLQGFEPILLRLLNTSDQSLAVLNNDGRVIVSNSADAVPAERLRIRVTGQMSLDGSAAGWSLCRLAARES
jgi:hypothetical protein